jgi:hypothetical protein
MYNRSQCLSFVYHNFVSSFLITAPASGALQLLRVIAQRTRIITNKPVRAAILTGSTPNSILVIILKLSPIAFVLLAP